LLDRTRTNYIGESIVDDNGDLQYLKIYGLSAIQTRRAYLLQTLDRHNWQLEKAATSLNETLASLVKRIEKADLGYLINNQIREQAEKALRKY
jgi:transcriptional regulator with GAF, ATPase, and Fis domain